MTLPFSESEHLNIDTSIASREWVIGMISPFDSAQGDGTDNLPAGRQADNRQQYYLMSNNYFSFRQFTIHQDQCAMKVGTDGVLLGAWVNIGHTRRILDVGTGTGLIALMCAQRSECVIDAVEVDRAASEQAAENSRSTPWNDRITVVHDSFQHFAESTPYRYDLMVSNPPFFKNSLKPKGLARSLARHDDRLSYEGLLHYAVKILISGGRLAVIIPDHEISNFTHLAYFQGLYPVRQTRVRPHRAKNYSRCLMEFSGDNSRKCLSNELIIKEENSPEYTREYKVLTKDFYLI